MKFDFATLNADLQRVYSPRVALRQVSMADGWPLFEATRNPQFNRHLMWAQPQEDSSTIDRIDLIIDAVAQGEMSAVSVVLRSTGEWIGLFRFQPYQQLNDTLEIGYWSHDNFWQGSFGIEVGVLCVDAAFKLSNVERIVGASSPDNRSSCAGLQRGGLRPGSMTTRTTEQDTKLVLQEYAVTREEWESSGRGDKWFNFREHRNAWANGSRPSSQERAHPFVNHHQEDKLAAVMH